MTTKELKAFAETQVYSFEDIKHLHDVIQPKSNRTKEFLTKILNECQLYSIPPSLMVNLSNSLP